MAYSISFKYAVGQEVYFLNKTYGKKGRIDEVNITVKEMNYECGGIRYNVKYKIKDRTFSESQLFKSKNDIDSWIDENLCFTKYLKLPGEVGYLKEADGTVRKVRVFNLIERINHSHPWKKKKVVEIFYKNENDEPLFRYVLADDIEIKHEAPEEPGLIGDFAKKYRMHYVEDAVYNFVSYDRIKY